VDWSHGAMWIQQDRVPLENNYSTIISTVANKTLLRGRDRFPEGLNVARKPSREYL
jgi:hypothetical protein